MYLVNDLAALLAVNIILTQALGTSTLFIAADNRKNLVGTAFVITFFTTAGSAFAYYADRIISEGSEIFRLPAYVLSVGILYVLLLSALNFTSRELFEKTRKYIHISAYNCAVMGTLFTVSGRAAENPSLMNLKSYVYSGLEAGIGFIIAALMLTAAYRKLNCAKVPAVFRGFPAMLVYTGIISMAVYALR